MDCCPKCGGRNGVLSDESQIFVRYTTWDGADSGADFVKLAWHGRNVRCNDCGARAKMPQPPDAAGSGG